MELLKILVVEDNEEQIELLKRILGKLVLPSEMRIMQTGEDALDYLKAAGDSSDFWFPDLVFLDLNLPGLHGIEILKQFKNLLGNRLPPVVIVSATLKAQDKVEAYRYGAACFLSKPYQETSLNEVMVQLRMTGRLKTAQTR